MKNEIKINEETSDLHPNMLCVLQEAKMDSHVFSFLFCSKYFISCIAKQEHETNTPLEK
jgi:hypothetical protein